MRRPHRLLWPLLAVLFTVLCTAAPATADYREIYDECEQGQLSKQYSAKDLRLASQRMSSYLRDYSNCSDAIYAAQTSAKRNAANQSSGKPGGASGTTGGGGGGTSTGGGTGSTTGSGLTPGTGSGSTSGPASPGAPPGLSADEKYIASTAATQQVDGAGTMEAALAAAKVPASALDFSSDGASLPLPLIVALAASGVLLLLAVGVASLPRLRRFRAD